MTIATHILPSERLHGADSACPFWPARIADHLASRLDKLLPEY